MSQNSVISFSSNKDQNVTSAADVHPAATPENHLITEKGFFSTNHSSSCSHCWLVQSYTMLKSRAFCTLQSSEDEAQLELLPNSKASKNRVKKKITEGTIWDSLTCYSIFLHWVTNGKKAPVCKETKSSHPSLAVLSHEHCPSEPNSSFVLILPWVTAEPLHSYSSSR